MIGSRVTVKIDRPMGSYHPKHNDIYYPINYGYIDTMIWKKSGLLHLKI